MSDRLWTELTNEKSGWHREARLWAASEITSLRQRLAEAERDRAEIMRLWFQDANPGETRFASMYAVFSESDLECEGPAHVCHNFATERAKVRRLRDWQRDALPELRYMVDNVCGSVRWKDKMRKLIEEAGHE